MEEALGLPEPTWQRRGKGYTVTYANLPVEVAEKLARHLFESGQLMLGQDNEPSERAVLYASVRAGKAIREQIEVAARREAEAIVSAVQ